VKKNPKIDFLLDSVVDEYKGAVVNGFPRLTSIVVKNVVTGELTEIPADGVFFGIGHTPNTLVFKDAINLDENGYIITTPGSSYTNVPGVFAAGDCQDHVYKQAITAAGSGCMAAIDCERWLNEQV
jgi:thioredoxin reductase (NADPH)